MQFFLLQSEAEHLCSSWRQWDLFILEKKKTSPLAEKLPEQTPRVVTFCYCCCCRRLLCACRCKEAKEGRQEARAHPNGLMRLFSPPGRKEEEGGEMSTALFQHGSSLNVL